MTATEKWVNERADNYLRQGGKTNRRETVRVLVRILDDIRTHEGCTPAQIGRKQVIGYYKRQQLSAETLRRHHAAIALLWKWLDRVSEPPRPRQAR